LNRKTKIKQSGITDCDIILVLQQGKLLEQGNHHELFQSKNLYSNYCADLAL